MACLYSGAAALIFPSSYEGFGLPLLEAMACGCPVITSRQASLPEVAGEAALYLDDELESRELLQAMQRLQSRDELRASLRGQGLQRAKAFSWKNTAAKTYQVFQELL